MAPREVAGTKVDTLFFLFFMGIPSLVVFLLLLWESLPWSLVVQKTGRGFKPCFEDWLKSPSTADGRTPVRITLKPCEAILELGSHHSGVSEWCCELDFATIPGAVPNPSWRSSLGTMENRIEPF